MSEAIIRRKHESNGLSYEHAEVNAIADIAKLTTEGWKRTSDIGVSWKKFRGNWRFVAVFTMSKTIETVEHRPSLGCSAGGCRRCAGSTQARS